MINYRPSVRLWRFRRFVSKVRRVSRRLLGPTPIKNTKRRKTKLYNIVRTFMYTSTTYPANIRTSGSNHEEKNEARWNFRAMPGDSAVESPNVSGSQSNPAREWFWYTNMTAVVFFSINSSTSTLSSASVGAQNQKQGPECDWERGSPDSVTPGLRKKRKGRLKDKRVPPFMNLFIHFGSPWFSSFWECLAGVIDVKAAHFRMTNEHN